MPRTVTDKKLSKFSIRSDSRAEYLSRASNLQRRTFARLLKTSYSSVSQSIERLANRHIGKTDRKVQAQCDTENCCK